MERRSAFHDAIWDAHLTKPRIPEGADSNSGFTRSARGEENTHSRDDDVFEKCF